MLDNYQYREVHLILQNNKSNYEKFLKIPDTKSKIKLIKEKSSVLNRKKTDAKVCQSEKTIVKSFVNKLANDENPNKLSIKWDFSVMIQNMQFCPIPRFLIVEVKKIKYI